MQLISGHDGVPSCLSAVALARLRGHISLNRDAVGMMFGQMALGLEPKGQYGCR
jgi:hypothetical protein